MDSKTPSCTLRDWLAESGMEVCQFAEGSKTKWHVTFEEGGLTHHGFVEQFDAADLNGVIEVDKRYRPFSGWPERNYERHGIKTHLHFVVNRDCTQVAVMTPASFGEMLDVEQPDRWRMESKSMVYRVSESGYTVFDLTSPLVGDLLKIEEF